jgi:serine/threonine protein kinase
MGNEKSRMKRKGGDKVDSGGGGGDDSEEVDIAIGDHLAVNNSKPVTIEDFDLLKVIGKGSFGKVMLVRHKATGALLALKTLKKATLLQRNQIAHTKTERKVLQIVAHPFIVNLKAAFQTPDKLYLVTDFAGGGELFFWLKRQKRFSESRARLYAAEMVLALDHLHKQDIVYRDLKPENILLDADGHIKLTDFGLSKEAVKGAGPEGGAKTFCGTPEYLAPEILMQQGHGLAVDWWSLATLLYEMMAGLPPFYDQNLQTMYEKIMTSELRFPRHFSPEARSLLTGMLQRDVSLRLGSRGADEIKSHAFFEGLDWHAVYERKVEAEFKPPVGGDTDVACFEAEFTSEAPVDSVVDTSVLSSTAKERTHFEGFTYAAEVPMGEVEDEEGD